MEVMKLKELCTQIVERFPAGREAAYIINNHPPDVEIVRQCLESILKFGGSDRRYQDEQSKIDAKAFLEKLDKVDIED